MKRKLVTLLLAVALTTSFTACGDKPQTTDTDTTPKTEQTTDTGSADTTDTSADTTEEPAEEVVITYSEISADGFTLSVPNIWETGSGISFKISNMNGEANAYPCEIGDPVTAARRFSDDAFAKTYGSVEYQCAVKENGDSCTLQLNAALNGDYNYQLSIDFAGASKSDVMTYMDDEVFTESMSSFKFDEAAYPAIDNSLFTINDEGFITKYADGDIFENNDDETGIDKLVIPSSVGGVDVKGIAAKAFSDHYKLKTVKIPNGVETIEEKAFYNSNNIETVILPYTLKTIGDDAFHFCESLKDMVLPEGLETIGADAIEKTSLYVMVAPSTLKEVGSFGLSNFRYLVLKNSDVTLADNALYGAVVYLDGVYTSDKAPKNLENQGALRQICLPMDATIDETLAFDEYLLSIGARDITWISVAPEFLPEDLTVFEVDDDHVLTAYNGPETELHQARYLPDGKEFYGISAGMFENSAFETVSFETNMFAGVGANAFSGSSNLKDIWFSGVYGDDGAFDNFEADSLSGLPDDITIHLPASLSDAKKAEIKDALTQKGISASANYEYYSYR